jgi:enoyl-CoA hydratase/carnithine racemase
MTHALVDVRREGAAAVIGLRRERKLNALSSALEGALDTALDHPDVRASACVVITGGPRAFSAGADVTELRDLDPAAILAYYRATGGVYERVARLPQPTISAIAGHCLGGGESSRSRPTSASPRRPRPSGCPRWASASSPARAARTG